jgi:hypothetical protein
MNVSNVHGTKIMNPLQLAHATQELLNGLGEVWENVNIVGVRAIDTHVIFLLKNALNLLEDAATGDADWVQDEDPRKCNDITFHIRGKRMFVYIPHKYV